MCQLKIFLNWKVLKAVINLNEVSVGLIYIYLRLVVTKCASELVETMSNVVHEIVRCLATLLGMIIVGVEYLEEFMNDYVSMQGV